MNKLLMINILEGEFVEFNPLKFFILKFQNYFNRETKFEVASYCLIGIVLFYTTNEAEVKKVFGERENIYKFRLEVSETF